MQPKVVLFIQIFQVFQNKMGKIKRERTKYHTVAAKKDDDTNLEKKATLPCKPQLNWKNIFAGINIQLSGINKFDENPKSVEVNKDQIHNEETSTETDLKTVLKATDAKNASIRSLTKKEKLQMKHKKLMEKLDATQKVTIEFRNRKQKQEQKKKIDDKTLLKSQGDICPMLTPAATKSSNENVNEQAARNVFSIPSFHDDLPALNSIFQSRKDKLCVQTKSSISKKKHGKKNFVKNYNFLKKSMIKKMK